MKKFITAVYFLCATTAGIFALIFLSRSSYILFPEAELKLELHELASIWLAWAFLPMLLATILFRRITGRRGKLFFVPAAICAGFFGFWLVLLILGVVVIVL